MRLAFVVPGGFDRSGGERVIPALNSLVTRLARRHDVVVFALAQEPEPSVFELASGVPVVNLGLHGPGTRVRALRLFSTELSRRGPFDLLHAFWVDTPGLLATLAGRGLGVPSVVSLGGGELAALPEIRYGGALRWRSRLTAALSLRLATAVTAASEPLIRLAETWGAEPEIVPLGVEPSWFRPLAPLRGEPPFRLLAIAHLNRVKDPETLLRAFRLASDHQPDITLDVVGVDTLDGAVQRLIADLGLAGRVTFHGVLAHEKTRALLARADLLVISSRHEAGPLAALEAWAMGVPVAGTCVGHLAEGAALRCSVAAVGDAPGLAATIVSLLRDVARRQHLAEEAQGWARRHDADATARAFEAIYARVRGNHAAA